jgi:hypothetical protein
MKNSLSKNGLSMSQAQSVSNLCNQRSREITYKLTDINNVSKILKVDGKYYTETKGNPIPNDVVDLLKEKARLSATQAFLMENIKAKDQMIDQIKYESHKYDIQPPVAPQEVVEQLPSLVDEQWGWDQLTVSEYNEYLEAEAYASHIGQFIHKGGTLDKLRAELPKIKTLEFMEIEVGKKTPLIIKVHHTSEQLMAIHEELAALHRSYEQKVNYYKAKVKNAVTTQNAAIENQRADIIANVSLINETQRKQYSDEYSKWLADRQKASKEFEANRQQRIQDAANLKIDVPARFQPVVDLFLNQLK